jgi:hypothetical protein
LLKRRFVTNGAFEQRYGGTRAGGGEAERKSTPAVGTPVGKISLFGRLFFSKPKKDADKKTWDKSDDNLRGTW